MDEATRTQAVAKLEAFDPRIGGPERFIDYSAMRVDRAVWSATCFAPSSSTGTCSSRLPNPVDRSLWGMNPQEINAYSPLANRSPSRRPSQPPFFDTMPIRRSITARSAP